MRVDTWPNEVDENFSGKGFRFLETQVTVQRVARRRSDNKVFGLKFHEDTNRDGEYTGFTWTFQGPWNDAANQRDDYQGPVPSEGQRINAVLHTNGNYHNIVGWSPAESLQEDTGRYNGPQPGSGGSPPNLAQSTRPEITTSESILRQVGFKAAVELLSAKMQSAKSAYDPFTEKEWQHLAHDVWHSYNLLLIGKNPESLNEGSVYEEPPEEQPTTPDELPWDDE